VKSDEALLGVLEKRYTAVKKLKGYRIFRGKINGTWDTAGAYQFCQNKPVGMTVE